MAALMPRLSSQQSMRFLPKHFPFFRYLLSSHCSHVYLHSQVTRYILSLFHVHPSAALCSVSTLLLMFVLGSWSVALLVQLLFPRSLHDLHLTIAHHDHDTLLLVNTCLFLSLLFVFPHCTTPFPFTREGLRISSPRIYIIHPPPRHFIVKFT
jgi:hypothetical protein